MSVGAASAAERVPSRVGERLERLVADSPGFVPALVAVGVFIWFAGDEGGFRGTTFLPAALLLLVLLGVALVALPRPRPPRAALIGIGLLAAYAAWSYLSIGWAQQKGMAWDGANRTVLYAIVLALFSLWPIRGRHAAFLLGLYGLAVALVGLQELLRAEDAEKAVQFFHEGRLSEPVGYENANAALWFTAFWPCVLLAGRREVPAPLRGLLLGSAGLLTCLAVLGQSRGWLFALPVMAIVAVAVMPGRGRTIVALAAVGAVVAPFAGTLTDYYQAYDNGTGPPGAVFAEAVDAALIVTGLLAVLGLAAGLVDRRVSVGPRAARRVSAAFAVAFGLACVGGVAAASIAVDDPIGEIEQRWEEFKSGEGEPTFTGSRLASTSFRSYRSDAWKVAWQNFKREPVIGVGADNFLRDYVQRGKSDQTPSYPHSLEFRVLSQTGIVGMLLLAGAFAFALLAARRALRGGLGLAGAAAGAAVVGFAYWVVHGSVDWFFEFPGLGGPAIGMLGLAVAVAASLPEGRGRPLRIGRAAAATGVALGVALAVGLTLPWIAERDLRKAREIAAGNPRGALERLDRAESLNPLSPLAPKTAALVEYRLGRAEAAKASLREALDRDSQDSFPYLQLAAIASTEFRDRRALALIEEARRRAPRDAVVLRVRRALLTGRTVSPQRVNELIIADIDLRIGPE